MRHLAEREEVTIVRFVATDRDAVAALVVGIQRDVVDSEEARLGESWTRGIVVLAWDHVRSGASQPADDRTSCSTNSRVSSMEKTARWTALRIWRRARGTSRNVLGCEFEELSQRLHAG